MSNERIAILSHNSSSQTLNDRQQASMPDLPRALPTKQANKHFNKNIFYQQQNTSTTSGRLMAADPANNSSVASLNAPDNGFKAADESHQKYQRSISELSNGLSAAVDVPLTQTGHKVIVVKDKKAFNQRLIIAQAAMKYGQRENSALTSGQKVVHFKENNGSQ